MKRLYFTLLVVAVAFSACRKEIPVDPIEIQTTKGFYLLNEGNMGSNKASLDYYDYATGEYMLDIFPKINPDVGFMLGDVGNDLQVYGNRLYAVINLSNMVEVMDKNTGEHIGSFTVPNCRYIAFYRDKMYVTSYAGRVNDGDQLGFVAEFDTLTMQETRRVEVGYQPDGLAVVGNRLYVANSGGYRRTSGYDNRLSVIDLSTLTEIKKLEVAMNLNLVRADSRGNLYVSARGNYTSVMSDIYKIDLQAETITPLGIENHKFQIVSDTLFAYSVNESTGVKKFVVYDLKASQLLTENFITDGTQTKIKQPYGIYYNPQRQEVYLLDAKFYSIPGEVFCYSKAGKLLWQHQTGDIPSSMVFITD